MRARRTGSNGLSISHPPRPAVFPNLKPSTSRVTLRMPSWLLAELKREANRRDVPYQSLLKMALADWLRQQSTG